MKLYQVMLLLTIFIACGKNTESKAPSKKKMRAFYPKDIQKLAGAKIYFGHMSVGYNITDGMKRILQEHNVSEHLNIVEIDKDAQLSLPAFYHSKIGKNRFPESKMSDFKEILKVLHGDSGLDIALFKFCYVDINRDTDVSSLFERYQKTIRDLKNSFPGLTIIHVTVPLTVHSRSFKQRVRNLIKGDLENVKRNEFNTLIRKKYGTDEVIYDLAKIESTRPDGSRASFRYKGKTFYSLAKEYTTDGGHLNEVGSEMAAEALFQTLLKAI